MGCLISKTFGAEVAGTKPEIYIRDSFDIYTMKKQNQPIQSEMVSLNMTSVKTDTETETDTETNTTSDIFEPYTFANTQEFSLNNKIFKARVVDIYDGDTCTCVIKLFDSFYKFNVRLAEIDTCEMKSKNAESKELACKARSRLVELVSNGQITNKSDFDLHMKRNDLRKLLNENIYLINIKCGEFDKYGRLLAYLFPNNDSTYEPSNSFNHMLINEKLAYRYMGDTKLTEAEQVNFLEDK